jgi:riboflavin biosynthesis pyrimidine reductase/flavin reductase (DIM6/NTAB) family NADH-FMN oxidoreductase RutF
VRRLVPRAIDDAEVEAAYADLAGRRASGRPYVAVNMVATADGAISFGGRTKDLSSEADRALFHYLRSLADVILVGAQTVRSEHYGPPRVSEARQVERVARGQDAVPRIAIVSGSLDLDWAAPLFTESPTRPLVLTSSSAPDDALDRARAVADVVVRGDARVDLAAALGDLDEGVVLCEGGPTLNGMLAALDLIDELCVTLSPALVGGDVGAGLLGHVRLPELQHLALVHVLEDSGNVFLRYRRREVPEPAAAPRRAEALGTEPRETADVDAFHEIVGDLTYPMLIVTATDGDERSGCLVGFSSQSSIDPPRYMVWLSKKNHTYRVATRAEVLTVHFPQRGQHDLAQHFGSQSSDDVDKFATLASREGPHGGVVLDDVDRWFVGRVTATVDCGDHVAFELLPVAGQVGPWTQQLGFRDVQDLEPGHPA